MTNPPNNFTVGTGGAFTSTDWNSWSNSVMQPAEPAASTAPVPTSDPSIPADPHVQWEGMPGSHYFEDAGHALYFQQQRINKRDWNLSHYPQEPNWTYAKELSLVDKLHRDWFDEPYMGTTAWSYDDLNLDGLETVPLRKHDLQPFKINYDTLQEVKLRLNNTAISIKGHTFVVKAVRSDHGQFFLAVSDLNKTYKVNYKDLTDLRSIPAMYVGSGWLCRIPARVYQQGLNRHNTLLKSVDCSSSISNMNPDQIVSQIRSRVKRSWDSTLLSLVSNGDLSNLTLSGDVAVKHEKGKVMACYRGRKLGYVQGNEVTVLDEDDLLQSWIEKPVKNVGLELRAA
jgi:hypothetical protein